MPLCFERNVAQHIHWFQKAFLHLHSHSIGLKLTIFKNKLRIEIKSNFIDPANTRTKMFRLENDLPNRWRLLFYDTYIFITASLFHTVYILTCIRIKENQCFSQGNLFIGAGYWKFSLSFIYSQPRTLALLVVVIRNAINYSRSYTNLNDFSSILTSFLFASPFAFSANNPVRQAKNNDIIIIKANICWLRSAGQKLTSLKRHDTYQTLPTLTLTTPPRQYYKRHNFLQVNLNKYMAHYYLKKKLNTF